MIDNSYNIGDVITTDFRNSEYYRVTGRTKDYIVATVPYGENKGQSVTIKILGDNVQWVKIVNVKG